MSKINEESNNPSKDIYQNAEKVAHIDEEGATVMDKGLPNVNPENEIIEKFPEQNAESNTEGSTIDVPGAELDDHMESIGAEDEENNYYSLGGDNHKN